jgi:hypothetical protein
VHHYTLDELYRLTVAAYQYNAALLEQAAQGATTLPADEHYSYDGVGNRLTDSADANGGGWHYNAVSANPTPPYTFCGPPNNLAISPDREV